MKTHLAAIALALAPAAADAAVLDIPATDGVGATLDLAAGVYDVTPVDRGGAGGFTAWTAWASVAGCDGAGADCATGWIMSYTYASPSLGTVAVSGDGMFATPALAFPSGVPSRFTLATREPVRFFIADDPYADNSGGVSLSVTPAAVVPLPGAAALLATALAALGAARRR